MRARIVLGNRLQADGDPSATLRRRLDATAERYRPGEIIIAAGGKLPHTTRAEAHAMRDYLSGRGIPYEQILCEDMSRTTVENAMHVAEMLRARELDPIEIITSAYHAPKAAYCFAKAYGTPIPVFGVEPGDLKERLLFARVPFDFAIARWQMRGV